MAKWQKCPRFGQSLRLDHDEYGWYLECIMCGFAQDLRRLEAKREPVLSGKGGKR